MAGTLSTRPPQAASAGWSMPAAGAALQVQARAMYVYPIKSCAGVRVRQLRLDADGRLEGDRQWVVTNANGELVWQGSHPRLALLQPRLLSDGLLLCAPGLQPVRLALQPLGEPASALMWNADQRRMERHATLDAGAVAAQFLRELTGDDLRLMRLSPQTLVEAAAPALHAITAESLRDLNEHLGAQGLGQIDERRLRPNLVLSGESEPLTPFVEEHALQLVWQQAPGVWRRLLHPQACERCPVTSVDPDSGDVQPQVEAAIAALSAQRWPGQASRFGLYLQSPTDARLDEGTTLTVELDF